MNERLVKPTAAHIAFRNDAIELLRKHAGALDAKDMLALSAHLVGQIVAMQDQRTVTPAMAMDIVSRNIGVGNLVAVVEVNRPRGQS